MLYRIADAEYQRAAVRVYNDWLSEFCAYEPSRLLGVAILPMQGPLEWATEEAERGSQDRTQSRHDPSSHPEQSVNPSGL